MPVVPDYEVIRALGSGGMGTVYMARNTLTNRLDALKVLSRNMVDQPQAMERFAREIRSAVRLDHRNIVRAYTAVRSEGDLILIMEYVEGEDLAARVERLGSLPVTEACFYTFQVAQGLQHAHSKDMVHRDIKPHNLILDRKGGKGQVKILDFGLAKVQSEAPVGGGITRDNSILGTADYVAPEQIRNAKAADIRADIYSLGCTLHFLLTGSPPFAGATSLYDIFQAHISQDAAPLNGLRADVPAELAAMVAKMMAKSPADRFQNPAEVAAALRPFIQANAAGVSLGPATKSGTATTGRAATIVEAAPIADQPPAGPGRAATIVEAAPIADQPRAGGRRGTIIEEIPLANPNPLPAARRSTLVEGATPAGSRRSTLVEDAPVGRSARATTIVETVPLRGGHPATMRPGANVETPIWRRPEVLAIFGIATAASVGLGLYLGRAEPAANTAPSERDALAVGPRNNLAGRSAPAKGSVPLSLPARPAAKAEIQPPTKFQRANATPDRAANVPKSSAGTTLGPNAPPKSAKAKDDRGAVPLVPTDEEPEAEPPTPPPSASSGGIIFGEYEQFARDPESYKDKRIIANGPKDIFKMRPMIDVVNGLDYADVRLTRFNDDPLNASDPKAQFKKYQLHIVLDKTISGSLKSFFAAKDIRPTARALLVLPTFEVRRDARVNRWLAVIVDLEVAVGQNNRSIEAGDPDGAFDLYHITGDGHTKVSAADGDRFARLGGVAIQKNLIDDRALKARRSQNKSDLQGAMGGLLNDAKGAGEADTARKKGQSDAILRGGRPY